MKTMEFQNFEINFHRTIFAWFGMKAQLQRQLYYSAKMRLCVLFNLNSIRDINKQAFAEISSETGKFWVRQPLLLKHIFHHIYNKNTQTKKLLPKAGNISNGIIYLVFVYEFNAVRLTRENIKNHTGKASPYPAMCIRLSKVKTRFLL